MEAQQRKFEGKIPILNSPNKHVTGEQQSIVNSYPEQKTPEHQKIVKRKEQSWWHQPSTSVKSEPATPSPIIQPVPVTSTISMGKVNNSYFDNCASLTSLATETNNYKKTVPVPAPAPTKIILKPSGSADYLNAFNKFLAQNAKANGGIEIKDNIVKKPRFQQQQVRKPTIPNVDSIIKDETNKIYSMATVTDQNGYQQNVNNYVARQTINPETETYAQLSPAPPQQQQQINTPVNYAMNNDDNLAMDYSYQNSRNYSRPNANQQQYSTTPAPLTSPSYTSSYTPTQQIQFKTNIQNTIASQLLQQQQQQQFLQQQANMIQFTQQMSQYQPNSSTDQAVAAMTMLREQQSNNQQTTNFNQQIFNQQNILLNYSQNNGMYSNSNGRVLSINEDK